MAVYTSQLYLGTLIHLLAFRITEQSLFDQGTHNSNCCRHVLADIMLENGVVVDCMILYQAESSGQLPYLWFHYCSQDSK
jgi:hypothetical protein